MAYPFRYPHENGWIVWSGCAALSLALKMAPSQTPGWSALSNALTVAPGRCTPKGEYPLVLTPPPESNTFWLSTMSSHGISCWFAPFPFSRHSTPALDDDPCVHYTVLPL